MGNSRVPPNVVVTDRRGIWIFPTDGFTQAELRTFWNRVDQQPESEGGHWHWTGARSNDKPIFTLRNKVRHAARIAWAVIKNENPPALIARMCDDGACINPTHYTEYARPNAPKANHGPIHGHDIPPTGGDELVIPPALQALGHIQFGTPFEQHVPRRLVLTTEELVETPGLTVSVQTDAHGRLTDQVADVAPAVELVTAPIGMQYTGDAHPPIPLTAEEIVDVLFQPGTVLMVFEDHVWLWNKKARVDAPDPSTAVEGLLRIMGVRGKRL